MKRCAICDYMTGHGSEWLGIGADKRKVRFRPTHNEYQCDQCFTEIKNNKLEMEIEDALKAMEKTESTDIEVCEDSFALSQVPF